MRTAATTPALEAAVANIDARFQRAKPAPGTPGAMAYAAHLAREAAVETIRRQHAAAITSTKGYHPGLGAIYHPTDTDAFLADQLEAPGVAVVREAYGFRTGAKASAAQVRRVAA